MREEIRTRKKRFVALCMTSMLLLCGIVSTSVVAADYNLNQNNWDNGGWNNDCAFSVQPGDTLTFEYRNYDYGEFECIYVDANGGGTESANKISSTTENGKVTVTVKSYSDFNFTDLESGEFKEWKVTNVYGSSHSINSVTLTAVPYTQRNITYVLDGGKNAESNPSTYYEGKAEITLADASKDKHSFDGWYIDGETKITSIPITQTGDITLYAKFIADTSETEESKETSGTKETEESKETSGTKETEESKETSGTKETEESKETSGTKETEESKETSGTKETEESKETSATKETKENATTKTDDNTPKTGDNILGIYMMGVLFLSGVTLLIFLKKRYFER